jgi:hypothetical protein
MLLNLLYGFLVMGFCLLLQSLLCIVALRYYASRQTLVQAPSFWSTILVILGVMLLLVIGNIAQVATWALLFLLLGEFAGFSEAVYHSAVNFATLGYGDIVMSDQHKLLGPLEAINGVLMIGVSTSALLVSFQDAMKKTIKARM